MQIRSHARSYEPAPHHAQCHQGQDRPTLQKRAISGLDTRDTLEQQKGTQISPSKGTQMGLFRLIATALTARAIGEYIDDSRSQPRGGDVQVVESGTYTITTGQQLTVQVATETPAVLDVNAAVTDGVAARLVVVKGHRGQHTRPDGSTPGPRSDLSGAADSTRQSQTGASATHVAHFPIPRLDTMQDPSQDAFMTRRIPAGSHTIVIAPVDGQTTTAHLDIKLTD